MAYRDDSMNGYSTEEVVLVETAKRTHRATTDSAQRAASVRARPLGARQSPGKTLRGSHSRSTTCFTLDTRCSSSSSLLLHLLILASARGSTPNNCVNRAKLRPLQNGSPLSAADGACVDGI